MDRSIAGGDALCLWKLINNSEREDDGSEHWSGPEPGQRTNELSSGSGSKYRRTGGLRSPESPLRGDQSQTAGVWTEPSPGHKVVLSLGQTRTSAELTFCFLPQIKIKIILWKMFRTF